jgi:acyl-coenzyme A thioesterase PaaI-like protein
LADTPSIPSPDPAPPRPSPVASRKRKLIDRFEDVVSRATAKYAWAHKLASMIWLPYAFRSGIKIKQLDDKSFGAVLPFRRFNRNWYNAMAGASLLANSEIVGGTYIHGRSGGDYTVVCKELKYRFLRPCYGPALYRITPVQDLDALLKTGDEFNFDIEIEIVQQLPTRGLGKTIRVGKCTATFHITPKALHEARARRRAAAGKDLPAGSVEPPNEG